MAGSASQGFGRMNVGFYAMRSAIGGSVNMVKNLSGGIKGLKLVLLSSGIGAIFLAIGAAIAGVMTYLKGTVEGQRKTRGGNRIFEGSIYSTQRGINKRRSIFG